MNGATAFTSCVSSSSTVETSASSSRHELRSRRSTCWRSWSSSALREESARRRRGPRAGAPAARAAQDARHPRAPPSGAPSSAAGSSSERRSPSYAPSSRRSTLRHRLRRGGLAFEHVPVEVRRAAHGLAGVVDDEVEPVAASSRGGCRTPRRSACGAGRARRSRAARSSPRSPAPGRSVRRSRGGSASSRSGAHPRGAA